MTTRWPHRQTLRAVFRQPELDAALDDGQVPIIVARGLFVVVGEAVVHALCGTIDAREHACVFADDAAAVRACNRARVWLAGHGRVDAYDHAIVIAKGAGRVRAADRSQVIAGDTTEVTLLGDAEAVCRDRSTVDAHGRARVDASDHVQVSANDQSAVRATLRASVRARDHAVVWADAGVTVHRDGPNVVIHNDADVDGSRELGTAWPPDGAPDALRVPELMRLVDQLVCPDGPAVPTSPAPR